ncbi:MAG: hypothetical protein IT336_14255 [Thermomicrobiales bacterium]|nr:hypothetical protein [Thermomicrobiales bacterium]
MTVKELIHKLVDELPDEEAARLLTFLKSEVAPSDGEPFVEQARPLWGIAGIGRSGRVSDIANRQDEYLAEAYDVRRR